MNLQKQLNAKLQRDFIGRQKHKYNEFYLQKWEICRKVEEQRRQAEAERARKQELLQFWIGQIQAYFILKKAAGDLEEQINRIRIRSFQNMRARMI